MPLTETIHVIGFTCMCELATEISPSRQSDPSAVTAIATATALQASMPRQFFPLPSAHKEKSETRGQMDDALNRIRSSNSRFSGPIKKLGTTPDGVSAMLPSTCEAEENRGLWNVHDPWSERSNGNQMGIY